MRADKPNPSTYGNRRNDFIHGSQVVTTGNYEAFLGQGRIRAHGEPGRVVDMGLLADPAAVTETEIVGEPHPEGWEYTVGANGSSEPA